MSVLSKSEPSPATPPDDAALVRRVRGGDADAGDELVRRHSDALLAYLHRLVRHDACAADDLHQATWQSALKHLDAFDAAQGGPGFRAWMFRIATNKATDHFRRRGREARLAEAYTHAVRPDADGPFAEAERREAADALRRAVACLPDAQRQVVELRFWGGLKFHEIADVVGCPINTALGRMHKALQKLRLAHTHAPLNAHDPATRQ